MLIVVADTTLSVLQLRKLNAALNLVQLMRQPSGERITTQAEQLLLGLLAEQRLPQLLAQLLLWLQQRPEWLACADTGAAVAQMPLQLACVSCAFLWKECLTCLGRIADTMSKLTSSTSGSMLAFECADCLTRALTAAGEPWPADSFMATTVVQQLQSSKGHDYEFYALRTMQDCGIEGALLCTWHSWIDTVI
jgi:hypothetical protein